MSVVLMFNSVACEGVCGMNRYLGKYLSGTGDIYTCEAAGMFMRRLHTFDYQDLIMNPLNQLC